MRSHSASVTVTSGLLMSSQSLGKFTGSWSGPDNSSTSRLADRTSQGLAAGGSQELRGNK